MTCDSYRQFVLDQLAGCGAVEYDTVVCRAMFGGEGLYLDGVFFAIVYAGRLYFKTDEASRGRYTELGMQPFRPSDKQTLKTYYEVPADIIEDPDRLIAWARQAAAAHRN